MESLVAKLREASKAYYETATPILTDAEYDALLEDLRTQDPQNPYLSEVGAPATDALTLPVCMPSLRKYKPDTVESCSLKGPFVVSDKLDGISALWVCGYKQTPALYLRGNGIKGPLIHPTHATHIQGLPRAGVPIAIVRGELIVNRTRYELPITTTARNWVNGILHQTNPDPADLKKIEFVAYQVLEPQGLSRSQQITWLYNTHFHVVWNRMMGILEAKELADLFVERRKSSHYECDGLVLGTDTIPAMPLNTKDPADAFAFKMAVADQCAETRVLEVEWASSRTKRWIPRIRFEPVKIGTATIEFCTGVHLANILEKRIGPGARIVIRRSGDVIPVIDRVLEGVEPSLPPEGRWIQEGCDALDTTAEESAAQLALQMVHTLVALGVPHTQKTTANKLVAADIHTIAVLAKTPLTKLQHIVGSVTGHTLYSHLEGALGSADELTWAKAYPLWPKGFGASRIDATFAVEKDVRKWTTMSPPKGMTMTTFGPVQKAVPAYLAWRESLGKPVGAPAVVPAAAPTVAAVAPEVAVPTKGTFVFSGFRDAELAERLQRAGWKQEEAVRTTTTVLLVPENAKETVKVQKARIAGVRIVPRSQSGTLC